MIYLLMLDYGPISRSVSERTLVLTCLENSKNDPNVPIYFWRIIFNEEFLGENWERRRDGANDGFYVKQKPKLGRK